MAIRIGVLGLAGMGTTHLGVIAGIDDYEVAAICDLDRDVLERAADTHRAEAFDDASTMFNRGELDAVVIATPPSTHEPLATAALEAGLHVYCEKPLARTLSESRRLSEVAARTGRITQVGFQHRFQAPFAEAKRRIDGGALGPIHRADLYATDWFRTQRYFDERPWRGRWDVAGGGVLMNQAIHHLDAFLWLVGDPERVTARMWTGRHDIAVEDDVLAMLEFPGGGKGVLAASTSDAVGRDRIEIHGDTGSLVVEETSLRAAALTRSTQEHSDDPAPSTLGIEWSDADVASGPLEFHDIIAACHADFVAAITHERPALNHFAEATRSVEVANAIYLSAIDGRPVDLPLDASAYDRAFDTLCSTGAGQPVG